MHLERDTLPASSRHAGSDSSQSGPHLLPARRGSPVPSARHWPGVQAVDLARASVEISSLLLRGDHESVRRAATLVDQHFRRQVAAVVRKKFPGLSAHDLADIWTETLLGFIRSSLAAKFNTDRPVFPFLCGVAIHHAIDHYRRSSIRQKALQEVLGPVAEALERRSAGPKWWTLDPVERAELMDLVRLAIEQLPPRQQLVIRVFIDNYPETQAMEPLRQRVSRISGRDEPISAVKRALQEAREKVRIFLRGKGYDLEGRRDL
jgi:DNA-directed RNA polymerase specialized sigma24 family protein